MRGNARQKVLQKGAVGVCTTILIDSDDVLKPRKSTTVPFQRWNATHYSPVPAVPMTASPPRLLLPEGQFTQATGPFEALLPGNAKTALKKSLIVLFFCRCLAST